MSIRAMFGAPVLRSSSGDTSCEVFSFNQFSLFLTFFRDELMWAEVSIPEDGRSVEEIMDLCLYVATHMGSEHADETMKKLLRVRSLYLVAIVLLSINRDLDCMQMMLAAQGTLEDVIRSMMFSKMDISTMDTRTIN